MTAIQVQHLYKVFGAGGDKVVARLEAGESRAEVQAETGAVAAVVDADFEVERGEIFVVMGLSGSGKSTLVRMINRLFTPTSGKVIVEGQDVTSLDTKSLRHLRAEKISMVFQHFGLLPHRTVLENVELGLDIRQVSTQERTERGREALEMVGLSGWDDSYPSELSGGMQQRVGLARALATDADILLMDEAFSALDPLIRREMQDQLIELQHELRRTIVFITHDLNEAMRLGDRIAVMKEGGIIQIGTAEQVLREPADDYVASFVSDVDRSRVLRADAVMCDPATVIDVSVPAEAASKKMDQLHTNELYVVGDENVLLGVVSRDDLDRREPAAPDLHDVCRQTSGIVPPDAPLIELFGAAATQELPVAVVDERSRLLGVVPRRALLEALSGDTDIATDGDVDLRAADVDMRAVGGDEDADARDIHDVDHDVDGGAKPTRSP